MQMFGIIQNQMGCGLSQNDEIDMNVRLPQGSANRNFLNPPDSFDDAQSRMTSIEDSTTSSSHFNGIILYFVDAEDSAEKQKQFFSLLGNKMGQLYTNTLSKIEEKLIKQEIGTDDLKVNFSKTILLHILNMINNLQERPSWKSQRTQVFSKIASCQQKIIEFLEFKYPRNKKDFIPTELEEIFYSVDDSEHTDYDILINAGINFDSEAIENYERNEVLRQIKKLINALIIESNHYFDFFKDKMEQVFKNKEGTFKIGRKISENVSTYADVNSPNMEIHSPEIFRVIIKFISSIDGVFVNSLEVLKKKKYLKILEKDDDVFSYFPLYTGKTHLISALISGLEPGSKQYKRQQREQQDSLANFNDNLARILTRKTDVPEINQNEIKTIKYAKYISKFVEFLAIEKLIYLITELVKLREHMDKKYRKAVDLINLNINDLLRSQFMGSKKAIIEVFDELKKLEDEGAIKIIRVKNRFATPLNDVLVNFKFVGEKNTFLVCEIQLILKKSGFSGNAKYEAHAKVNHVLYELQRSIFGPMAEMSLLLTHNDTRMGYENKINLEKRSLHSMRCPEGQVFNCEYDLPIPYVCSLCSAFYHINQNSFPVHRCLNCNFYVCPSCLFEFDPELSEQCYYKEIFNVMKEKYLPELDEHEDYGLFFFNKKYLKVKDMLRKEKNFFDCLEEKMVELEENYACILRFFEGKKYFNVYHLANGELLPTFYDLLPRFERKDYKNLTIGPYDIVLFLDPNCTIKKKSVRELNLSLIPLTDIEINLKQISDVYFFKIYNYFLMLDVGEQLKDSDSTSIVSTAEKSAELEKILEKYRPREGQLLLDYMDLTQINFHEYNISNIRFAKLKSNRIRDLSPILQYETLEEIDMSRNELSEVKFEKCYSKLRVLDFSENFIEVIAGLDQQHIPNAKELNLSSNNIEKFPIMELPRLLWLNVNNNRLASIEEIRQSMLSKLRKLSLRKNKLTIIPPTDKIKELLDIDAGENQIESLEFIFSCPKIEQIFMEYNEIKQLPDNLRLFELEHLDLSHNKIKNIRSLGDAELPVIKLLNFSYNLLRELPVIELETVEQLNFEYNELESVTNLYKSESLFNCQRIYLEHNKIEELPIVTMEGLKELYLSHNKLKEMSSFVHSKILILETLDLSSNAITLMPNIDMPFLKRLNLSSNLLTSMEFVRESIVPELKWMSIEQNRLQKFISTDFPALEELYLQRNELTDLTEIMQEHLNVLKILSLSHNKIVSLPKMHMLSVQKLSLQKNVITSLELFKESTLPQLKTLDLRFNFLTNFPAMKFEELLNLHLDSNEISDMSGLENCEFPNLEELRLPNNKLKDLAVLKLPKLALLNLQINEITDISVLRQYVTPEISELKLMKNNIKKLCSLKSNSLTLMDASHNKIVNVGSFFESELPKLLFLKLNNNSLEGELKRIKFPSLKSIDVAKNSLSSLNDFSQHSELPKLDNIKANNNKIEGIQSWLFPKLKQINLNNNAIREMEDFEFSELPKIQKLFLENNQLTELPKLEFNTILTLSLDGNQITNLEEFCRSDLPSLEKLFMRANRVKQWPQQFYLQKLVKLNLSENLLTDFRSISHEYTPELRELNLKKNRIESIHEINLPNLLYLNLDNNPIADSDIKMKQAMYINKSKLSKKLKLSLNRRGSEQGEQQLEIPKMRERISM